MAYFSTFETRDKLILLYFLQESGLKLTETDLLHIALDNGWMNYFDFARVTAELKDAGMLATEKRLQGELLIITPQGQEVLEHFAERLPLSLRRNIREYAASHKVKIRQAGQHSASYRKKGEGDYLVSLQILDKEEALLSLEITLPTEEMAKTFVNRWPDRSQDIFAALLRLLGETDVAE